MNKNLRNLAQGKKNFSMHAQKSLFGAKKSKIEP